jgi:hypothetical protein
MGAGSVSEWAGALLTICSPFVVQGRRPNLGATRGATPQHLTSVLDCLEKKGFAACPQICINPRAKKANGTSWLEEAGSLGVSLNAGISGGWG